MASTDQTKYYYKKEKSAPKTAQNRTKTRENLAEKKEPPCAAQLMQAYGKSKLVKELQEHRAEQKAEERRSEQAQAVDTLSEEAEITAGAAIEEGMGLLASDLQHLQEWRHAEPPPLPPLIEVPPAPEPVYPISAPKSDAPRKLPTRQVSRLPSSTPSAAKAKPARSISTGRAVSTIQKSASQVQLSQLMQQRGKLLFRRKRMQAQRVKLQQRHEMECFGRESTPFEELYPIAEWNNTASVPPSRPVSQVLIPQNYSPGSASHSRDEIPQPKPVMISAQDKRRLIMQKRQKPPQYVPESRNPTDMPQTAPLTNLKQEAASVPIQSDFVSLKSAGTRSLTAEERHKFVMAKRRKQSEVFSTVEQSGANHVKLSQMRSPTAKVRQQMVMEKRQKPTSARQTAELEFPLAPAVAQSGNLPLRANSTDIFPPSTGIQPSFAVNKAIPAKYSLLPEDRAKGIGTSQHTRKNARKLVPAGHAAQSKSLLARQKLAQSKLQKRLSHHTRMTAKASYQRAWQVRQVRQSGKIMRRGVAAITNTLQRLLRKGISLAKNAGVGAFACLILLALVLMVGMVGALAGSPFGVLFSPQETSPEAKSVGAAVAEVNNEYFGKITDIINNTDHDELMIHRVPNDGAADTRLRTWEEILAVFAVKTTTDPTNATDVVMIDDDRTDRLKEVLWDMVSVSKRVETTDSGEDKTRTLHLTITVKTPDEAAQEYNFNRVQTGALTEMLLPENKALLTELIGWATGTGGAGSIGGVGNINGYEVPPDALSDERFAAMLNEAKKYLGMPYVWGGSSPSTSFDCSGFVCWVLNKSGAMSIERTTATGIYNRCTVIPKSEAKPGDLIFFTGTYNSPGPISHIGIYVGDGMMVHAGDPIQFASIESNYWKQHFYAFTRIP